MSSETLYHKIFKPDNSFTFCNNEGNGMKILSKGEKETEEITISSKENNVQVIFINPNTKEIKSQYTLFDEEAYHFMELLLFSNVIEMD